jgi:hypothetical protein
MSLIYIATLDPKTFIELCEMFHVLALHPHRAPLIPSRVFGAAGELVGRPGGAGGAVSSERCRGELSRRPRALWAVIAAP